MAGLRGRALVAYLVVCVVWGSTYLAIRVGVGVLPPFLFAGLRFFIAGVVLLTAALALGDTLPKRLDEEVAQLEEQVLDNPRRETLEAVLLLKRNAQRLKRSIAALEIMTRGPMPAPALMRSGSWRRTAAILKFLPPRRSVWPTWPLRRMRNSSATTAG